MESGPVPPQNSICRRHLGDSRHRCRSDFRGVDSCRYRELDPGASVVDYTLSDYHERSKHRVNRYAPGPGQLDWANQPNPFRYYEGSTRIELPLLAHTLYRSRDEHTFGVSIDRRSVARACLLRDDPDTPRARNARSTTAYSYAQAARSMHPGSAHELPL